jgi:hypothetical protein
VESWAPDQRKYHDLEEFLHPKHSRKFPKGLRGGDDDDPLKKEGALSTRGLQITLSINPATI